MGKGVETGPTTCHATPLATWRSGSFYPRTHFCGVAAGAHPRLCCAVFDLACAEAWSDSGLAIVFRCGHFDLADGPWFDSADPCAGACTSAKHQVCSGTNADGSVVCSCVFGYSGNPCTKTSAFYQVGAWSACSASCAGGLQTRSVDCVPVCKCRRGVSGRVGQAVA